MKRSQERSKGTPRSKGEGSRDIKEKKERAKEKRRRFKR